MVVGMLSLVQGSGARFEYRTCRASFWPHGVIFEVLLFYDSGAAGGWGPPAWARFEFKMKEMDNFIPQFRALSHSLDVLCKY